jgi:hypothetical protein
MKIPTVQNNLIETESLSTEKRVNWGEGLSEEGNSGSKRRENRWRNGYEQVQRGEKSKRQTFYVVKWALAIMGLARKAIQEDTLGPFQSLTSARIEGREELG